MTAQPTVEVVRRNGERATFAIRDLSLEGARLVGPLRLSESERVELRIALEAPLSVAAEVTHYDQQHRIAHVAFRDVARDVLAQIERSIADLLARVRAEAPPTAVIVHTRPEVSSALERDLARIKVAACVCANVAELEELLADRAVRYVAVIVGIDHGPILQHVEDHHPELRRVALYGEQIAKIDHPAAGRVHAVLRTPWHFKGLARALEVPADTVVTTYDQLVALKLEKEK